MIKDQYTHLATTMSRQQLWQLRKKAAGRCIICGGKLINSTHCKKHRGKYRRWNLKHYHAKKLKKIAG